MSLIYWLFGLSAPGSIARATGWLLVPARPVGVAALAALAAVAAAVAALNLLPHSVMRWRTRVTLALVRLAGFAVLALMLCQLDLRLTAERVLPPNVAVLTDTSASMGICDVGGKSRLDAARALLEGPLAGLGKRANLLPFSFAWQLRPDDAEGAAAGMTRLMAAVEGLARREDDLQAVILLTDGNDTAGTRCGLVAPLLASRGLPVYPVVFGQPGSPRLARVKVTEAAAYVRLGDELRLTATVSPGTLHGEVVRALLFEDGRKEPVAARENVRVGEEPVEIAFVAKPSRAGLRTYRIVVEGGREAPVLAAEHKVLAIDARIRVLYVDIPRDERKILGHWLARDPVVDLSTLTLLPQGGWYAQGALQHKDVAEGLPGQEADQFRYDVVILGDIPRSYFRAGGDVAETKMQRLVEFVSRRGGGLVTLGGQSVYAAGQYQDSPLATVLPFVVEPTDAPQVPKPFKLIPTPIGLSHPVMQLAWEPQANRDAWFDLPTLEGCNRVERVKPGASLLAVREVVGGSATQERGTASRDTRREDTPPTTGKPLPVMAVQNAGKGKVLSLAADTTWRWEMQRPAEGEDFYRRFWGNAVRFLAPDPRIAPNSPQILRTQSHNAVGERITLATRLVDAVYKPIRDADLAVKVTSPSGKTLHIYPRDGRDTPGVYEYSFALDEPGPWQVATAYGGKTSTDEIVAGDSDEELDDPAAKPDAMAELAKATGGKVFTPEGAAVLGDELHIEPRRLTQTAAIALWNLPATMVLMALLVAADCFLRKRRGMV